MRLRGARSQGDCWPGGFPTASGGGRRLLRGLRECGGRGGPTPGRGRATGAALGPRQLQILGSRLEFQIPPGIGEGFIFWTETVNFSSSAHTGIPADVCGLPATPGAFAPSTILTEPVIRRSSLDASSSGGGGPRRFVDRNRESSQRSLSQASSQPRLPNPIPSVFVDEPRCRRTRLKSSPCCVAVAC